MTTVTPVDEARAAAQRSGVEVRPILEASDCVAASAVLAAVWRTPIDNTPMKPDILRALAFSGAYVHGAYDPALGLVGVCVGFLAEATADAPVSLHSHVTGVLPDQRRRGLGLVLKLHQRSWALERGMDTIAWTCDPLVRRNMLFNLHRLGATIDAYIPDFYGAMSDGLNTGDASDRAHVTWHLRSPRPPLAGSVGPETIVVVSGQPVVAGTGDARRILVPTPADVESLRSSDLPTARAWRHAMREVMEPRLRSGWTVAGITSDGDYVLEAL